MSGDWIKMRTGLEMDVKTLRIARELGITPAEAVAVLYRAASWFHTQGKFGKVRCEVDIFDLTQERLGLSAALATVDWLRTNNGILTLHGFCTVSAMRKGLGVKLRREILTDAKCAACGAADELVIDHVTPIVRGGSCERHNLQPLCAPCNRRKGRKTMAEFMA